MNSDNYQNFLEKFAASQHTAAEHAAFQEWLLRATPAQVQAALDYYEPLQRFHFPTPPTPEIVAALEARLDGLPNATTRRIAPWWSAVAAALALLLLAGAAYFLRLPTPALAYRQQHTAAGRTARLTLADGTVVRLNGNSTLSYPVTFGGKTREVQLRGEAYFDVAKDPAHPFIIHSGRLQTRVVGTRFNVYAYPQASRQEVTVLTGQVLVTDSASGQAVALRPAQKAVLAPPPTPTLTQTSATAAVLAVEPVAEPAHSTAWQQGQLIFEQAALAEITDKLSLRYGVQITLGSAQLRRCRLTVAFGPESLANALAVLTALTGSTYTQQAQQIVLTGNGC